MVMPRVIRQSPSGPLVDGTGLPGSRCRMTEDSFVIGTGANLDIPTVKTALNLIDFNNLTTPITLEFDRPNPDLYYRAEAQFDMFNNGTNDVATTQLYIDYSTDDGATWTQWASNTHDAPGVSMARVVDIHRPMQLGSELGITDDTETFSIRFSAACPLNPALQLSSLLTTGPSPAHPVGTFYWQLEELA